MFSAKVFTTRDTFPNPSTEPILVDTKVVWTGITFYNFTMLEIFTTANTHLLFEPVSVLDF